MKRFSEKFHDLGGFTIEPPIPSSAFFFFRENIRSVFPITCHISKLKYWIHYIIAPGRMKTTVIQHESHRADKILIYSSNGHLIMIQPQAVTFLRSLYSLFGLDGDDAFTKNLLLILFIRDFIITVNKMIVSFSKFLHILWSMRSLVEVFSLSFRKCQQNETPLML